MIWPIDAEFKIGKELINTSDAINVLVVENDKPFAEVIKINLQSAGYHPIIANSCEDAEKIFDADPQNLHLLITRVLMGGPSGVELGKTLQEKNPQLKILYTCGELLSELTGQHQLTVPESAFLRKPFGRQDLLKMIAGLIGD